MLEYILSFIFIICLNLLIRYYIPLVCKAYKKVLKEEKERLADTNSQNKLGNHHIVR